MSGLLCGGRLPPPASRCQIAIASVEPPMSAYGYKRTFSVRDSMSAFGGIADVKGGPAERLLLTQNPAMCRCSSVQSSNTRYENFINHDRHPTSRAPRTTQDSRGGFLGPSSPQNQPPTLYGHLRESERPSGVAVWRSRLRDAVDSVPLSSFSASGSRAWVGAGGCWCHGVSEAVRE